MSRYFADGGAELLGLGANLLLGEEYRFHVAAVLLAACLILFAGHDRQRAMEYTSSPSRPPGLPSRTPRIPIA